MIARGAKHAHLEGVVRGGSCLSLKRLGSRVNLTIEIVLSRFRAFALSVGEKGIQPIVCFDR
jgi:hypothetical protein